MEKFYLGMDIGTESVGMACTDEQYNLLRKKGKELWAVRLFDEALDASERRIKRTARRRLQRRRQRIEFLQGIFAPFMTDDKFFLRLNNSGFYEEDKHESLQAKFSLFADAEYTDADFYKMYPTIFHLRQDLVDGKKADLRHYYLALHHIIKYRGHFLFEGETISNIRNIKKLFEDYNNAVDDLGQETDLHLFADKAEEFRLLAMERKGINDQKKACWALFGATTAGAKEIVSLLVGAKVKAAIIFGEEYAEKYKDEKISFKEIDDDAFEQKREVFEMEHFTLLEAVRAIYNFIVFEKVLNGYDTISQSMVARYTKHKKDLEQLKYFVKSNYPKEVYYKIFRSTKEAANYANYIGYNQNKNNKIAVAKCKTDDFYKFLKKTLGAQAECQSTLDSINAEIDNGTFLPKILNADNGLFPHQINGQELILILQNLCRHYPVFNEKDADGYTPAEKIKSIFLFKIPYYVGPLNTAHENNGKGNSWMVRKAGKFDKITPWNFDEIVDKPASNEKFIRRMTNKCSYLHNQDVLPKGSMYYQAFDTLNQINKLTVGGAPISVADKQELFKNVFLTNKKVGLKQILDYFVVSGKCSQAERKELSIAGFDAQVGIRASMSSYVLFKGKFGAMVDAHPEIFENIILWHTLNTDKTLVESMILQNYGNIPDIKENIKWLKGLTAFKEFGRLSKKLLYELSGGIEPETGVIYTFLNRLYHTNDNFNQLLFSEDYSFSKAIDDENGGKNEEVTYDDVAELYVSPMVRRGIWQALQMTDEYVKAVGKAPDKIFIEVTRQDGEKGDKGRTVSRKNKILDLYKGLGADCQDFDELIKELNHEQMTDSRLRQERLYLYFLQLGRCAYTGERIDLTQLSTDLYDVDHIIPQSMTKDDSFENKVLVNRQKNAQKTDVYPLPSGFTNQQGFWKMLKAKGLMSETKYARLTRTKPLEEDDFRAFINRQLVVTNQTVKAVAELLKRKYESQGTKIVYSKAINVDDFKQRHSIIKCRETNDLHHARDAYLNIVVGNVYDTKFTSAYDYYYRKQDDSWREYNLKHLFNKPIIGAWAGEEDIARIKSIAAKTSMQVTRYAYGDHGKFYKETVFKKDDKCVSYPRKGVAPYNIKDENGFYKYGGYSNVQSAYFVALEFTAGKKVKKVILGLPVMTEYQIKGDPKKIKNYFEDVEGLKDVRILVPKIKKNTLISYNGYKAYIVGASDNRILFSNAVQWFTDSCTDTYVKNIGKLLEMVKQGKISHEEQNNKEFAITTNRFKKNSVVINEENNNKLYDTILKQLSKTVYQGLPAFVALRTAMEKKRAIFTSKCIFEQAKGLINIVGYLRRGNSNGLDLSVFDESKNACALRVGYDISKVDFAIIHQSPCGLTERIQKV